MSISSLLNTQKCRQLYRPWTAFVAALCTCNPSAAVADINVADMPREFGVTYRGSHPNSGNNGRVANGIGDFNKDGFKDFAIGSPLEGEQGVVYVILGHPGRYSNLELFNIANDNSKGFRIVAPTNEFGALGYWVDGAGDFNGDGFDDLIMSSFGSAAYIVYGRNTGIENISLDEFHSSNARGIRLDNFRAESVAGAGDINNDGFGDILLGDPYAYYDFGRNHFSGKVTVIFGRANPGNINASTFVTSDDNGFTIQGTNNNQSLGVSLGPAGDFNRDGYDDFVVTGSNPFSLWISESSRYAAGNAFLFYGKAGGYQDLRTIGVLPAGLTIFESAGLHPETGANIGKSGRLGDLGDFNGDGYSDVVMSSEYEMVDGHHNSGSVFIVYGQSQISGSIPLANIAQNNSGVRINGLPQSYFGSHVNFAGDLNNDGRDDLLLVAKSSAGYYPDPATVYVVYSRPEITGTVSVEDITVSRNGGYKITNTKAGQFSPPMPSAAGDANGDGFGDFLLYYINQNSSYIHTGDTHLMFGGAAAPAAAENWSLYD